MGRLIDEQDAYDVLTDYYHHSTDTQHAALKEALGRVETVDAVEVVRCKNCKYWRDTDHTCRGHSLVSPMTADDFCSYGKKDGAHEKLIELDAALDALREVIVPAEDIGFGDELTDGYNDGINMAVTVVSGLPTVDAAPVRHGRWKEDPSGYGFWICSACGFVSEASAADMLYKFCPVCGAKMDGDGE